MIPGFTEIDLMLQLQNPFLDWLGKVCLVFNLSQVLKAIIGDEMILIYLDPGSGSFLIQLLIAALAGAGIAIAIGWGRIRRFFSKNKPVDKDVDEDEDDEQPGA
jgi:hypothetical protein